MKENSFYIARFNNGEIDRKINLTQRDLTLAFVSGRFQGYKEGDIRIYKIDLDSVSVTEVSVSEILERIENNKVKRTQQEECARRRAIQRQIEMLKQQL